MVRRNFYGFLLSKTTMKDILIYTLSQMVPVKKKLATNVLYVPWDCKKIKTPHHESRFTIHQASTTIKLDHSYVEATPSP